MITREDVRKALVDDGITVAEAAERFDVSPGRIYQLRKELEADGVEVPKGKAGRRPGKPVEQHSNGSHPTPAPEKSVEETVARELEQTQARATAVAEQIEALQTEQEALKVRETVLAKAQEVLQPKAVA